MASDSSKLHDATEAELAVLRVLWESSGGSATIRTITGQLYPAGGTSHYATVQKVLERLEEKGLVTRDRSESVHRFSAAVAKEELIGRRLRAMADALCEGSLAPLLTSLVSATPLSSGEIRELRELVDRLDRQPPPAKKRKK